MHLSSQIEAVLFFKGEPLSYEYLAKALESNENEVRQAVNELDETLRDRGLTLIHKEGRVLLASDPEIAKIIENLTKEDMAKDLSKAAIETLSIILYRGPISKAEIDYIRGVNSAAILRNLLIKGLAEKHLHPEGKKISVYEASFDLLSHLGVQKASHLPEYEEANREIDDYKNEMGDEDVKS